ncbi:MAG: RCC1 domain-containing protein, partial [Mycoplasma sp.]
LLWCTNGTLYSCGNSVNGIWGWENVYDKETFPRKIESQAIFYQKEHSEIMKESPIFQDYSSDFKLDLQMKRLPDSMMYVDCSFYNTAFITNTGEWYMSGKQDWIPKEEDNKEENNDEWNMNMRDKYITKVTFFREKVNYIALGKFHIICIAEGKAYSWGKNVDCICGISGKCNGDTISKPTLIETIKTNIKMACVSDTHSMLLTTNGEIYAFGSNTYGKLGIGDLNRYFTIGTKPMEAEPIWVKNITVAQYIACSSTHSACIMKYDQSWKDSYSVYTWGSGFNGKLGHNNGGDVYEPKLVEELNYKNNEAKNRKLYFIKVALGNDFSLALDENGQLWGWGKRKYLPNRSGDQEGKDENPQLLLQDKI